MTKDEYNSKFWMYYLNLEEEFCDTLNFVELIEDNFSTYSKQFARQLVSIGSEIDITFKALCREINPDINAKCITDYAKILCGWNDFPNAKVQLKTGMKRFVPFEGWTEDNKPFWWECYNDVKHHRAEGEVFKEASLKNVLYALIALFVLNRYLCKEVCKSRIMQEPEVRSRLFEMEGWRICFSEGNGFVRILSPNGNMSWQHE